MHRSCPRPPSDTRYSLSRVNSQSSATACPELAQRAQLADQGSVDVQRARAPAMDHMKGRWSQKLTHVRACGVHVLRMERCTPRLVRHCGLQRRTRRRAEDTTSPLELTLRTFFFTLRRSQGAMGRYQGTSGAAWAASGRVKRPRGPPCGIPGVGEGLIHK